MADDKAPQRATGSLRDALAAAARPEPSNEEARPMKDKETKAEAVKAELTAAVREAKAAVEPRGGERDKALAPPPLPSARARGDAHVELDEPTTRAHRPRSAAKPGAGAEESPRTQLIRGKSKVTRAAFHADPVVGWLVVVGGPGLGAFRPVFEGNNTLGRSRSQRVPIDFGDDTISSEEQAYIRYDSADRSFLFVPNLAKTNIVSINDRKPTAAVVLTSMDVITIGRTQLVFVPFCGEDFDWAELAEMKD